MPTITSKRGRDLKAKEPHPVDIEINIGDYDDDFEDTMPMPTTDDEEYEYFIGGGYDDSSHLPFKMPVVHKVKRVIK